MPVGGLSAERQLLSGGFNRSTQRIGEIVRRAFRRSIGHLRVAFSWPLRRQKNLAGPASSRGSMGCVAYHVRAIKQSKMTAPRLTFPLPAA